MRFAHCSTSRLYLIAHCVRGVEGAAREHKRKGAAFGLGVTLTASGATSKQDIPWHPTLNQHREGESLCPKEVASLRRNTSGGSRHLSRCLCLHILLHPHLGRHITVAALASLARMLRLRFQVFPQVFVCVYVLY